VKKIQTENNTDVIELVKKAQSGDSEAMSLLCQEVSERILPYIQGLTLNYDMSQDVLQETLLELVKSLENVKKPESFWCWVYRQALGKAQRHYRGRSKQRSIVLRIATDVLREFQDENLSGLKYAVRMELTEVILKAMSTLKMDYRNVLILRCFEKLSFAEIAQTMQCKEIHARVLFLRARKSLEKNMRYDGFDKEYLLAGLVIFRILTKPTEVGTGTALITASILNVDAMAVIINLLASKSGFVLTCLATLFTVFSTTKSILYAVGVIAFVLYVLFWFWLADLYTR